MVLKISEHIEDFETRGFTVFRNVLPASLITQLREVTDRGREQARQRNTSQTQRIQLSGPQYLAQLGCEYFGMYKVFRA